MNVILARIELSEAVEVAVQALSKAVRNPNAAEIANGHRRLLALADPIIRCAVPWGDWESAITRARTKRPDFVPGFLLYGQDLDLLLDSGVPEAIRDVFTAAQKTSSVVLQCFPEEEK